MDDAHMVGFGFKQAWLAIRVSSPAAGTAGTGDAAGTADAAAAAGSADPSVGEVLSALGARDLGEVDWAQGIDLAYLTDDRLAVTPPLVGVGGSTWILVAGRAFFGEAAAPDVAALSGRLGTEVQFFATHRVVEAHFWERAADGSLVRSFRYVGETGEVRSWYGKPDATELAIGLPPDYALDAEPDDQVNILVDELDVLSVAAAWSLDPSQLDGRPAAGRLRVGMVATTADET
jgi:hypothetical protein